jgi:hypothetical protein
MSRGLGTMQQWILDAIPEWHVRYGPLDSRSDFEEVYVDSERHVVEADRVVRVSTLCRLVAARHHGYERCAAFARGHGYRVQLDRPTVVLRGAFKVSFSRAVRGLIRRGVLRAVQHWWRGDPPLEWRGAWPVVYRREEFNRRQGRIVITHVVKC